MSNLFIFLIMFIVTFCFINGGVTLRSRYAYKVSNNAYDFFQNYVLSYLCSDRQIHESETFYPELNAKMQKLLSLALVGEANVGLTYDPWSETCFMRIEKPISFDGTSGTIHFKFQCGRIDNERFLFTPSVFILAEKVYKMQTKKEKDKKDAKKRKVI